MDTFTSRVERTGGALADAFKEAAADAWSAKGAYEFGTGLMVGSALSLMQKRATFPFLLVELGTASFVANTAIEMNSAGGALANIWRSDANYAENKHQLAQACGSIVFDTILSTAGGFAGASCSRTALVAVRESSLLAELNSYHPESLLHSERVGQYSHLLSKEMGLSWSEQRQTLHAGRMHDIGKLDIPIDILGSTGRLSDEQMAIMRTHAAASKVRLDKLGYRGALSNVPTDAAQHHEWLNGKGYPDHITGDKMSRVAKMLPVSDVFDAMTGGRKYSTLDRKAGERMPLGVVKNKIDNLSGTQFDPATVDSFWNIRADKMVQVLESAPDRPVVSARLLEEFKGAKFGRLLDVLNGSNGTEYEQSLADKLKSTYNAPPRS